MRILGVGELTQWTVQNVRTWIPGVHMWDGLRPGLLNQELPQVGRVKHVGRAWTVFELGYGTCEEDVPDHATLGRRYHKMQEMVALDDSPPFPLQQGPRMRAEIS